MCGILGYTGNRQAAPILLDGLAKLEYRGYDSAGLAVLSGEGQVNVVKAKGRLKGVVERTEGGKTLPGTCGIGHTRWATHGEPSDTNAHPLWSDDMAVVAVHNGIIENYRELREELGRKGYQFYSQTDTEAAVKLIDFYYKRDGDPLTALISAVRIIRGSYCFVLMFKDCPGEVWGLRKDNPLIAGQGEDEAFLASDVSAILQDTRQVYYLDNLEIARLRKGEIRFFDRDGQPIQKELSEVTWDAQAAERGGFEHFMMKEIHEQAKAVRDTLHAGLDPEGGVDLSALRLTEEEARRLNQVYIVACGSAYHAGVVGQYVIEELAGLPVRVELASEFRYRDMPLDPSALAVVITQSGETADTLAALRLAKERGLRTLGIINVVGSSISREADAVFYTLAGPEIAVATTKAYSAQLIACYLLALHLARLRGKLSDAQCRALLSELDALPQKIDEILDEKERVREVARRFTASQNAFFLGRNIDYAVAMEGSLKMKEISYLHSEACAAGEMKHGPISLVEKGMPVFGLLTQPRLREKTLSNLLEVKSRGACLVEVAVRGQETEDADFLLPIPQTDPRFAASLAVIPLQLLGYYLAVARGLDVDKPRNLAKSVTVE